MEPTLDMGQIGSVKANVCGSLSHTCFANWKTLELLPRKSPKRPVTERAIGLQERTQRQTFHRRRGKGEGGLAQDLISGKGATKAVFDAVNLQRRSVTGQPCMRLKRAAPKRALAPDKLAAMDNAFEIYIRQAPLDVSPGQRKGLMNKIITEQLQDIDRKQQF